MSADAPPPGPLRLDARELRTRWPGLVWAVPLAAILIVIYLALNALSDQGVDIVVSFNKAAGARAGDTPVVYKGVHVGRVVKIRISSDAKRVDMTLRMAPETRNALRDGAKFWLIGATPSLADLSSLQAVVSGVSIGASPGTGSPRRRFIGLDEPPPVPTDMVGTPYLLTGDAIGSTRVGAGVYYRGLEVGKVSRIVLTPSGQFQLNIFVSAPYDKLVRGNTEFFSAKPLRIQITSAGLDGELGPGTSPLMGGIEFDLPEGAGAAPRSPAGAVFPFYSDASQAADGSTGHAVSYQAVFHDAAGALQGGAPIYLAGFPIGRVAERRLVADPQGGSVFGAVTVEIEPESLGLSADGGEAQRRLRTDQLLRGLIRRGYRLEVAQNPPVVGPPALELRQTRQGSTGAVSLQGPLFALPTADAPSLGALTERADTLLTRLDAVPIEQIGHDVRRLTHRLADLAASPEIDDGLKHLDRTLADLDQITSEAKPKVGPLVDKLSAAADQLQALAQSANRMVGGADGAQDATLPDAIRQLSEAARSIRTLAEDLDRHPESILKGRRPQR
jgi:paraquat-inducible protein B